MLLIFIALCNIKKGVISCLQTWKFGSIHDQRDSAYYFYYNDKEQVLTSTHICMQTHKKTDKTSTNT